MGTKTRTKLYSALLSVMMLVNLVPTPALAEGEPQSTETPVIVQTETPATEPENNTIEEQTLTPATEEVPLIPVEGNTDPVSTETPVPEQTPVSEQEETPASEEKEKQDADSEETAETETDSEENTEKSEENLEESEKDVKESEDEEEEVSYPAVTLSETVEGVTVTLNAPEGSLPAGVHMTVIPVHERAIFEAVDGTLAEEGKEIASAVAFDITLYDAKDNKLQPNKYVTVSFSNTNLSSAEGDGSIDVYRVSDDASEVTPVTTVAATENNQMVITNHFTIYVLTDSKGKSGTPTDPNGDDSNTPNSRDHIYYLDWGDTVTLATSEPYSSIHDTWYVSSSYIPKSIEQVGLSSFKNTNPESFNGWAVVCHEYGLDIHFDHASYNHEYFYIYLKTPDQYNVEFKFRDVGSNEFSQYHSELVKKDHGVNVPRMVPTKTVDNKLYIFSGWCSNPACTEPIPASNFKTVTGNITAYGTYKELQNMYVINYHGNADDCTYVPAPSYSSSDKGVRVVKDDAQRPGYIFRGWATTSTRAAEGKVDYYYYNYTDVDFEGKTTLDLYAVWEERVVTIDYSYVDYVKHRNWGTITPRFEWISAVNGTATGSTATPNPGYTFVKWTDKNGNTVSTNPTFIPEKVDGRYYEETEYFAVFEQDKCTVRFDTNGGSKIDPITIPAGSKLTPPANPTKSNCTKFSGWYSNKELTSEPFDFDTTITSDITLYAKWIEGTHNYEPVVAVPATCETAGHIAGYTCSECGKHFKDVEGQKAEVADSEWIVPAKGHNWSNVIYTWGENNTTITARRTCNNTNCPHPEDKEELVLDPSLTELEPGHIISRTFGEPTCTTPGGETYIAVFKKPAFEVQVKSLNDKPALGHDWPTEVGEGKVTFSWSSDYSSVVAVAHCQRANCHAVETEPVATTITGNTATCTHGGQITYTATFTRAPFNKPEFDSYRVKTVDVSALGHDWEDPSYVWNGVTEVTASHTCKRCKISESETSKTEDNKITVTEFPATCGHDKYTTYKATFTKFHFTTKTVVDYNTKTNHEWGTVTYDWADDNSHVVALQHCKNDWSHVQAVGAEATETITEKPTCTETGLANYTAIFSAPYETQTKNDVDIPALGHDWGEWEVVKDPTAVEEGLKQRVCAHDNSHVETEALPKVTYSVKTGNGQTWTKGSDVTADFEFERSEENEAKKLTAYDLFTEVLIDGKKVTDFTKEKGSVITKIYASYLETLSAGDHKITAKFSDGGSVTASFTVKDKEPAPTPAAPVDNVVTCQMAGYPANYSWNEAAKACQPGYIDAAGNFHPYSTKARAVPNTYDQGLAVHTWILGISALTAVFCALTLRRDS